jgi:hypothetical protein
MRLPPFGSPAASQLRSVALRPRLTAGLPLSFIALKHNVSRGVSLYAIRTSLSCCPEWLFPSTRFLMRTGDDEFLTNREKLAIRIGGYPGLEARQCWVDQAMVSPHYRSIAVPNPMAEICSQ